MVPFIQQYNVYWYSSKDNTIPPMILLQLKMYHCHHCFNCHILFPRLVIRAELTSLQTYNPSPQLRNQTREPLLDKCHNIRHASIDALDKLMRRTTSRRKPHVVVISIFVHWSPLHVKKLFTDKNKGINLLLTPLFTKP